MLGVEECVRQIRQRLLALTVCHRHLVRVQPRSDKNLAHARCSEVLEQPFEGTALFSRKKEKRVSWNYKLCLYAVSTLQPE